MPPGMHMHLPGMKTAGMQMQLPGMKLTLHAQAAAGCHDIRDRRLQALQGLFSTRERSSWQLGHEGRPCGPAVRPGMGPCLPCTMDEAGAVQAGYALIRLFSVLCVLCLLT